MTAVTITAPPNAPQDTTSSSLESASDADLLRQLWRETLKALLQELRSGEAKASAIAVARAFLDSNNVSLESLDKLEGKTPGGAWDSLAPMLKNLPSFDN